MASEVERRQQQRADYLVALYEMSDGNSMNWISRRDIGAQAGIPQGEVFAVGQFLSDQRLAQSKTGGGPDALISMTPRGIQRAEDIITEREQKGAPRYSNLVVFSDGELLRKLEPLLGSIRAELDNASNVDPDTLADLSSDLASANDQLHAAKPNRGVIKASMDRIAAVLPTVANVTVILVGIAELGHGLGV
jgi:hypothetical protein